MVIPQRVATSGCVARVYVIQIFLICSSIVFSFTFIRNGNNSDFTKHCITKEWFSLVQQSWWEMLMKRQLPSGRTLCNFCLNFSENFVRSTNWGITWGSGLRCAYKSVSHTMTHKINVNCGVVWTWIIQNRVRHALTSVLGLLSVPQGVKDFYSYNQDYRLPVLCLIHGISFGYKPS